MIVYQKKKYICDLLHDLGFLISSMVLNLDSWFVNLLGFFMLFRPDYYVIGHFDLWAEAHNYSINFYF